MNLKDIHCHILPAVDDGPASMKQSAEILREMKKQGVKRIIVTPHYRPEMFEASAERIWRQYLRVKELADAGGIQLFLGCEHYRNDRMIELIKESRCFTMAFSDYVLVEFSSNDVFSTIRNYVYELQTHGYTPIIAHIERYQCCDSVDRVTELRNLGAQIQVNAGSVLGGNGRKTKAFVRKLMEEDLIDFIASDAHDCRKRKPNIGKCAAYVERKFGRDYTYKIFVKNPGRIIKNGRLRDEESEVRTTADDIQNKGNFEDTAYKSAILR